MPEVVLRPLTVPELPQVWAHMSDAESAAMAGLPVRSLEDFTVRWSALLDDPATPVWAIVVDGVIGGNAGVFRPGEVGYWVDRSLWGQGIASEALRQLLDLVPGDVLTAHVSHDNAGSLRVLAKHGFVETSRDEQGDVWLTLSRSGSLPRP